MMLMLHATFSSFSHFNNVFKSDFDYTTHPPYRALCKLLLCDLPYSLKKSRRPSYLSELKVLWYKSNDNGFNDRKAFKIVTRMDFTALGYTLGAARWCGG